MLADFIASETSETIRLEDFCHCIRGTYRPIIQTPPLWTFYRHTNGIFVFLCDRGVAHVPSETETSMEAQIQKKGEKILPLCNS